VSSNTGVPLYSAGRAAGDPLTQASSSALFSASAQQIKKCSAGGLISATAFYEGALVLHVAIEPLVLTLVAPASANVGALRALIPGLREQLQPLCEKLDSSRETLGQLP